MPDVHLEKSILEPPCTPRGLAFVAHGRLGGTMYCTVTSAIAEHLHKAQECRVVRWNARGVGQSEGGDEYSSPDAWMGEHNSNDYKAIFTEEIQRFLDDYPETPRCQLFVCGYSSGAIYATTIRYPHGALGDRCSAVFPDPIKYILVSYPIAAAPVLNLLKTGTYFRALEGVVGGYWEHAPDPERRADVLILMGTDEIYPWWYFGTVNLAFDLWCGVLDGKHRPEQSFFKRVVVDYANHVWSGQEQRIGEEIGKWVAEADAVQFATKG